MTEVVAIGASFHMWVTFAIILGALALFALEWTPMEVTSIGIVCALLLFFSVFPVLDPDGANELNASRILEGFANPALVTVLALLVMGQGMVRTGVLDHAARLILRLGRRQAALSLGLVLAVALAVSGFLNNIPVVVIFIPVMQMIATRFRRSVSKVMMPLSFAAVLGGMTTLVGSSTNLLVNSALIEVGQRPFGFFEFSVLGSIMAAAGFLYVYLVAPMLLKDRASFVQSLMSGSGRQFIAQITLPEGAALIGKGAPGGIFADLPDMTVHVVRRGEKTILPPFEGLTLRAGDVLVVAATRQALRDALAKDPVLLYPVLSDEEDRGENREAGPWHGPSRVLAEAMVTPGSNLNGRTLQQIGFRHKTGCIVLGVQRRSRMLRLPLTDIRFEAGDVLLVQGQQEAIDGLKVNADIVLIEWSTEELPALDHAKRAVIIFVGAMTLAAGGLLPIVAATLTGAVAMVASGVLNVSQAARAIDPRIVATIGAALGMGVCLEETGGAAYLAHLLLVAVGDAGPAVVLALFFLLVAGLSNIISTKTCAVLFTPIAVDIALEIGIAPQVFAVAVVFAANCSFASPLGYQTNLLVMGPGHYRFLDFTRAGAPLIILLWLTFALFAPMFYGL